MLNPMIKSKITDIMIWHNAIDTFDYNLAVDWAIELINKGLNTESVFMLASFSKPVESQEIKPYINPVLKELGLQEKYGEYSTIAKAHYHLDMIIHNVDVWQNLTEVYNLCNHTDHAYELTTFYRIYHAWWNFQDGIPNWYFEGATPDNIEQILMDQARIWIEKYVQIE